MSSLPSGTTVAPSRGAHLHGPTSDFLLLGGASLVPFFALQMIELDQRMTALIALVMMLLANLVNHPHFASSYVMFFGAWRAVHRDHAPANLLVGWWIAGVVVPLFLATVLLLSAHAWLRGDTFWMGLCVNLMGALVGWHYVKQGFGMAMTDAALKRSFWSPRARQALLWNAYACWACAWTHFNVGDAGSYFWGVFNTRAALPGWALHVVHALVAATSAWLVICVADSIKSWRGAGKALAQMPWVGFSSYLISVYLWTAFATINATYLYVIPFFHSLQYLTVVWRYKANEYASIGNKAVREGFLRFSLLICVLGALGFWGVPALVEYWMNGHLPPWTGGASIAMAVAWLFINVHHYFIDTVLWRQGNPLVSKHLFGR